MSIKQIYGPSENFMTVVLDIFINKSYGEITSNNVRRNGGMIDSCQVRGLLCQVSGRTEVWRCVLSVRRRPDGTVARRCRGVAPGGTVARWWRTRLLGCTVVARWRTR